MATVIWLLRRHRFTGGRLGFHQVSDELPDSFITKRRRRSRKAA